MKFKQTDAPGPNELANDLTTEKCIQKGDSLFNLSNYKEALKYFDKAIALNDHNVDGYFKKVTFLHFVYFNC